MLLHRHLLPDLKSISGKNPWNVYNMVLYIFLIYYIDVINDLHVQIYDIVIDTL